MHMDSITMLERETCKLKIMGGYNIHFDHHPARTHARTPRTLLALIPTPCLMPSICGD